VQSENRVLTRGKGSFISGTLKGLAEYYGFSLNRLQFAFLFLFFCGVGLPIYIALWISIPSYSQREKLLNNLQRQSE